MRNLIAPAALTLSLVLASGAAFAATTPAPAAAAKAPAAHATKTASTDKMKACGAKWKAEAKHTATKKDFMASCEKA